MDRGYQGVQQDRLAAVNAVHSDTAMRLIEARDRMEGKSARAAFSRPASRASLCLLDNMLGEMPMRNPSAHASLTDEDEADLRAQLDARVQKILGIMAIMINDAEADIAAMNDLLDIIRVMDRDFFDYANDPETAAGKEPRQLVEEFVFYYLKKYV
jgi:hypothetical protein